MQPNISFPKIQTESAVQPADNHSFLRVERTMASCSSKPALPTFQTALVRTDRPPGASSNHERSALDGGCGLLRSKKNPRVVKEYKRNRQSAVLFANYPIFDLP